MDENDKTYLKVEIGGMTKDGRENPVVLLKATDSDEVLPIWIGHAEALAIELQLEGKSFSRPLTHDLLKTMLEGLSATVAKVAITELKDNTFYAKIYLQRENEIIAIDARPSDSIALALRTKSDIYVAQEVFDGHKKTLHEESEAEESQDEKLRNYLRDLDPGDF